MKKLSIALAVALTALTTGCTTFHASQSSAELDTRVSANINADIDVGDKISGDSKVLTILGLFNFGDGKYADGISYGSNSNFSIGGRAVEEAKSAASYKAISSAKADVIVMPRYSIEVNDFLFFKNTGARVTGNKGVIKSFKSAAQTVKTTP